MLILFIIATLIILYFVYKHVIDFQKFKHRCLLTGTYKIKLRSMSDEKTYIAEVSYDGKNDERFCRYIGLEGMEKDIWSDLSLTEQLRINLDIDKFFDDLFAQNNL